MSDAVDYALRRAVRAERVRLGLTQEELAARIGRPRSRVTAIETGGRLVTVGELADLCVALGCTLGVLLQMAPEQERRALGV